ncbi:MAG: hypothetical protein JWM82_2067, partial [Myxococcales bacterium]|nr:hypothetical protein [Myxococcales bacterium]
SPDTSSRTNLARSISALVCFHGILERVKDVPGHV